MTEFKKVLLRGKLINIQFTNSFKEFIEMIKKEFKLGEIEKWRLQYTDKDGDIITVNTQEDYMLALEESKDNETFAFTIKEKSPCGTYEENDKPLEANAQPINNLEHSLDNESNLQIERMIEARIIEKVNELTKKQAEYISIMIKPQHVLSFSIIGEQRTKTRLRDISEEELMKELLERESLKESEKLKKSQEFELRALHESLEQERLIQERILKEKLAEEKRVLERKHELEKQTLQKKLEETKAMKKDLLKSEIQRLKKSSINIPIRTIEGSNKSLEELSIIDNSLKDTKSEYRLICSMCEEEIEEEICNKCTVCKNTYICKECTEDILHEHSFIPFNKNPFNGSASFIEPRQEKKKIDPLYMSVYVPKSNTELKIEYDNESDIQKEVHPKETFTKSWTFLNSGKGRWEEGMIFGPLDQNVFEVEIEQVPSVLPGKKCTITLRLTAPEALGHYKQCFAIQRDGKTVGKKVWIEIDVVKKAIEISNKAKDLLLKLKEEEYVPEEYEASILHLLSISNEDPKWILSLLKNNNNNIEAVTELILS